MDSDATAPMDFEQHRSRMVEEQLARRGITDERVLQVMATLPRELFVPPGYRYCAYRDGPLEIGCGQTISQPYMTALMAQELALRGDETVLEVGTGSGYHAAVLAGLCRRVISVEVVPELVEQARANLAAAGVESVTVVQGDGSLGYAAEQPYDAISVAAAAPAVPAELTEQLRDPGKLVIPVGNRVEQQLRIMERRSGQIYTRAAAGCRFVPLVGAGGWPEYGF